jgi:hypothetical protein
MPNLKLFCDDELSPDILQGLREALPALRGVVCLGLDVDPALAQLALIQMSGLSDQALIAVEMQIAPAPARTCERLTSVCEEMKHVLAAVADVKIAFRVTTVDPANYLVLR